MPWEAKQQTQHAITGRRRKRNVFAKLQEEWISRGQQLFYVGEKRKQAPCMVCKEPEIGRNGVAAS